MGWWDRLMGREAKASNSLELLREIYGGVESNSGLNVTWKTALGVSTVLACARVIADGVSTVPLKLFQKDDATGRRAEASSHPLFDLLTVAPNDWQTALEFRETLSLHLALCFNAYAFINRVGGRIVELIPLEPGLVSVEQAADYSLTYKVTAPNGQQQAFPAEAIWHIRGPSWNGWMGLDLIKQARDAIGLAMATEQAQARMHKNGAQPGGLYTVDGTLTSDQFRSLRKWINENLTGASNAGTPLILDRGAKWQSLSLTGADAQTLEARRMQVEEICRFMGVMPIMIGFTDKTATYASAEQMFLAHAVHGIRPWHRRWEASIRRSLLSRQDRAAGIYPKFLDGELLRGAAKDRAEYYRTMTQIGAFSPNDILEMEDMDGYEGGDRRWIQSNMMDAANPMVPTPRTEAANGAP